MLDSTAHSKEIKISFYCSKFNAKLALSQSRMDDAHLDV